MVGTRKRKATSQLDEAEKRQRVEESSSPAPRFFSDEDDDDDEYDGELNDFSDDGQTAETPSTPFSPGRKKFPSELKTLKCSHPGCTKTFNRPIRLQTHLKIHTNERTFVCTYDDCDKAYFEDKHLQAHIKGSHTHERKHHCTWEDCTKSFLTATRLRRHLATHEGHERFRCKDFFPCKETFRKHQTLQRHIRSEHLELSAYPCRYVDPITNKSCTSGFDGPSGLRRHEETAHGAPQFFCANCVIPDAFNPDGTPMHPGFTTNTQLQTHIRKEHTNNTCIFCDKQCSNERQLQIHIDTKHSGATLEERKKVRCTYIGCDKSFTKTSNLNTHIRSAHMGERFICGEADVSETKGLGAFEQSTGCGKDFVSKQFLEDHIRIAHLGQKSLVNGNRTKAKAKQLEKELEGFIDDADENGTKSRRKKRVTKNKLTAMEKLTGKTNDPAIANKKSQTNTGSARQFSSPILPQPEHQPEFQTFEPWQPLIPMDENMLIPSDLIPSDLLIPNGSLLDPLDESFIDTPVESIDWALEREALQGGPFWIGDGGNNEVDQWNHDEMEMKRLIGDDYIQEPQQQLYEYPEL